MSGVRESHAHCHFSSLGVRVALRQGRSTTTLQCASSTNTEFLNPNSQQVGIRLIWCET